VAPSSKMYLIFMLLKVHKINCYFTAKNYQHSLKCALQRRKKLHWPRLIWPTRQKQSFFHSMYSLRKTNNHVNTKHGRPASSSFHFITRLWVSCSRDCWSLDQSDIDCAVDEYRKHLRACVCAEGRNFERLL